MPQKIIFIILYLFFSLTSLFAQVPSEEQKKLTSSAESIISSATISNLSKMAMLHDSLMIEYREAEASLREAVDNSSRQEIEEKISELREQLQIIDMNFSELVTGVNSVEMQKSKPAGSFNWADEIRDLLSPLINEVKRLTNEPRQIDRLKNQIYDQQQELQLVNRIIENAELTRNAVSEPKVLNLINELLQKWELRKNNLDANLSFAKQKLNQREQSRKTFFESLSEIFDIFFKSRGRNILVALLVTFLFVVALKSFYQRLLNKNASFVRQYVSLRFVTAAYYLCFVIGSILVPVFVLYLFGDWVLLIVCLLILFGLLWASKQALPKIWTQLMLLLNMGAVREGERLIYRGLPWRVDSLNFYSELSNPALSSAKVRLPLKDILDFRSYPVEANTRWFPTKLGDWLLLTETDLGQVLEQNPDFVKIKMLGGELQLVPTVEFVKKEVVILSEGFRIVKTVKLALSLGQQMSKEVPIIFARELEKKFAEGNPLGIPEKLQVDFHDIGAYYLELYVSAYFAGTMASSYLDLKHSLAAYLLEIAAANSLPLAMQALKVEMPRG